MYCFMTYLCAGQNSQNTNINLNAMLKKLTYQSLLSVSELDSFLSEFLRICSLPVDEPEVENREVLLEDIRLANKIRFFSEALAAYQLCIRRSRKMSQTEVLVQLKEQRA